MLLEGAAQQNPIHELVREVALAAAVGPLPLIEHRPLDPPNRLFLRDTGISNTIEMALMQIRFLGCAQFAPVGNALIMRMGDQIEDILFEVGAGAADAVYFVVANHLCKRFAEFRRTHRASKRHEHFAALIEVVPIGLGCIKERRRIEVPIVGANEVGDRHGGQGYERTSVWASAVLTRLRRAKYASGMDADPSPRTAVDLASHRVAHTPKAIRDRLSVQPRQSYLRDFIYGAIDGAVTTFAIVAGVAGAGLSPGIVLILGVANLIADGFSMAVSNYLGTRADDQLLEHARRTEHRHIEIFPEGEREEIRQIFAAKGFEGDELERIVKVITSDREQWVDTMLREELGLSIESRSPWKAGLMTLLAFILVGALPLLVYFYDYFAATTISQPFFYSAVLTGVAFFIVGALKSRFVNESWYRAGLETLGVGSIAAVLAYVIGVALRGLA